MTDTLAPLADDLFTVAQTLKSRIRKSTVDYNRLSQAEKCAADALVDDSQVRFAIEDGRKVLKHRRLVGVLRFVGGGFI